ncbi:dihydroneopterin aldolase [Pedobacter sp. UC225_65]|uniref:dihydroneopterin aldolase n=1 Tax=Pedobacter sp. UC225_65 TaxID=3350173 RepID=UPI0036700A80
MFVQTVALREVKFYAFHGFYPEEQFTGNHFLVDVEVTFIPNGDTEDLSHTVNYEVINTVVTAAMKQTQKLLETVIKNIIDQLIAVYPFILTAAVGIKKLHPPMPGEIGHSFVQLTYTSPK